MDQSSLQHVVDGLQQAHDPHGHHRPGPVRQSGPDTSDVVVRRDVSEVVEVPDSRTVGVTSEVFEPQR